MLLKCRFHFSLRSKPQTLKAHIFQNMHKWPKKFGRHLSIMYSHNILKNQKKL